MADVETTATLAALKGLTARPAAVIVQGGLAFNDGYGGTFVWFAGDATPADDVLVVQCITGAPGRYKRLAPAQTVSLGWCLTAANPLQKALDVLGPNGGRVTVPQGEWIIPGAAASAANLRNFELSGEGPDAALIFPNGGGGLTVTFGTPSGTEEHKDQLVVKNLAILTTYYAAPGHGKGSGVALAASWATAVGDVSQGVTIRDVEIMPKNHNPDASGRYARWDTGLSLDNARQVSIDNSYFAGGALQTDGVAIDLKGGTVGIWITNCVCADLDIGVYAHGVAEGIKIETSDFVCCNYKLYVDGDELGSARSTSTSPNTIGTGARTFSVSHTGLAWLSANQTLIVRDVAAPSTNYMIGTVTGYSGRTLQLDVTSARGSGTRSNWTISPEHHISDIKIGNTHGSCVINQVHARWTAFVYYNNNMDQKREGTSRNYADMVLYDHNTTWFIHDSHFLQRADGGSTDGILVESGDGTNGAITIHDLWFGNRDRAIWLDGDACNCVVRDIHSVGDVRTLLLNTTSARNNRISNVFNAETEGDARTVLVNEGATPSLESQGKDYFGIVNSAAQTVTGFRGGHIGQIALIALDDRNTTFKHGPSLLLKGGVDFTASAGDTITFVRETASRWREVSRSH